MSLIKLAHSQIVRQRGRHALPLGGQTCRAIGQLQRGMQRFAAHAVHSQGGGECVARAGGIHRAHGGRREVNRRLLALSQHAALGAQGNNHRIRAAALQDAHLILQGIAIRADLLQFQLVWNQVIHALQQLITKSGLVAGLEDHLHPMPARHTRRAQRQLRRKLGLQQAKARACKQRFLLFQQLGGQAGIRPSVAFFSQYLISDNILITFPYENF